MEGVKPISIAILAVLLSIIAIISGAIVKPVGVPADSVGNDELKNNAVTTSKIADGTIISSDLNLEVLNTLSSMFQVEDGSVTSAKIVDETITSADIHDGAVGTNEIEDEAVTSDKLASDALVWNNITGIPMEIAAAGFIKSDATVECGYNVIDATCDTNTTFYTINISGYNYTYNYITLITFGTGSATYENIAHSVHGLNIWLYNSSGNHTQDDFYFVTYKIN